MDPKAVEMAYRYMEKIQGTDDWTNWKYINPEDPIRPFLQQLAPPTPKYLLDDNKYQEYLIANLSQTNPDLWDPEHLADLDPAMRDELLRYQETYANRVPFEDLPTWQRMAYHAQASPVTRGVATALPFALAGGLGGLAAGPIGGAVGFLAPLALGTGLSFAAERSPTAANLMEKLDYPAAWLEQGYGTFLQATGAIANPDTYGPLDEVLTHFEETKQAARLTYETGAYAPDVRAIWGGTNKEGRHDIANIFPAVEYSVRWIGEQLGMDTDIDRIQFTDAGEIWPQLTVHTDDTGERYVIGDYEPVQLDAVGMSAVVNARRELIAGADPNEVMLKYSEQFGFSGEVSDLIGHIVLDPLNIAPTVLAKGIGTVADLTKNPVMARAYKTAHGPIEGWKKYRAFVRTGVAGAADELTAFQRFAGGLNEQGIIRKLVPETSQMGPIRRAWQYLRELTPVAKSRTILSIGADNIMNYLDYVNRLDPEMKLSHLRKLIWQARDPAVFSTRSVMLCWNRPTRLSRP
jgi:hypothetical protein